MAAVAWKEWREAIRPDRGSWIEVLRVPVALAIGLAFAWRVGPAFGAGWLTLAPCALVAVMAVLPLVGDSFAGERERHTLETLLASRVPDAAVLLGKVAAPAMFGWALSLAVLAGGVALARFRGAASAPDPVVLGAGAALGLVAGVLVAAVGALVSLHSGTAREAQQRLSLSLVLAALLPGAAVRYAPAGAAERLESWARSLSPAGAAAVGLGVLAVLAAAVVAFALLRFARERVRLD